MRAKFLIVYGLQFLILAQLFDDIFMVIISLLMAVIMLAISVFESFKENG